jgi:hypothetical protein
LVSPGVQPRHNPRILQCTHGHMFSQSSELSLQGLLRARSALLEKQSAPQIRLVLRLKFVAMSLRVPDSMSSL